MHYQYQLYHYLKLGQLTFSMFVSVAEAKNQPVNLVNGSSDFNIIDRCMSDNPFVADDKKSSTNPTIKIPVDYFYLQRIP